MNNISVIWAPLLSPLFWQPDRIGVTSAWWGHVPFAFWLVTVLQPRSIVELGAYTGVSYSAFCQAVQTNQIVCRCTAVDTWQGDEQTGFYSNQVFSELKEFHDNHYSAFSVLLREKFEAAVNQFEDGSIDLLHIDGFHQYEAVKKDFESWLPKLSDRGVVLFHDSNERSGDFGVWRLIAQLRERYPVFEFLHSHGLAIAVVGAQAPAAVQELCRLTSAGVVAAICERFAFAGARWMAEMQKRSLSDESALLKADAERASAVSKEQIASLQASHAASRAELEAKLAEQFARHVESEKSLTSQLVGWEMARQQMDSRLHEQKTYFDKITAEARAASNLALASAQQQMEVRSRQLNLVTDAAAMESRRLTENVQRAHASLAGLQQQLEEIHSTVGSTLLRPLVTIAAKGRKLYQTVTLQSHRYDEIRQAETGMVDVIKACGLFDTDWYRQQYSDVALAGIDPILHYVRTGEREGRKPNPVFDPAWYAERNLDLAGLYTNYLVHYSRHGSVEGRSPHPLFDSGWYRDRNPDVTTAGVEPLAHYLAEGSREDRWPNPLFDPRWYRDTNADVAALNLEPLDHYQRIGSAQGRRPIPLFDPSWYRSQYPDVASSGSEALSHYRTHGFKEHRRPCAWFDSVWYLAQYVDVKATGSDPLAHYLHYGAAENRMPNAVFKPAWYRSRYPDVAKLTKEPLGHYVAWGWREGRQPVPDFDPLWYLSAYPDVRTSGLEPFAHYLLSGKAEHRRTHAA